MLPRKWKIFRIVSYLHLTAIVLLAVIAFLGLSKNTGLALNSLEDVIGVTLMIMIPTVLIINCIINLALLDKNYPAIIPGSTHRIMSSIFFSLTVLMLIVLVLFSAAIIVTIFHVWHKQAGTARKWPFYILLGAVVLVYLTGIYVIWNQVSLRKALRRNHRLTMENFLEPEEQTQP
jgi:hypothetical protein